MTKETLSESKIFYESGSWQRFIHWIYINDEADCILNENSETKISEKTIVKALHYAYLNMPPSNVNVTKYLLKPLKQNSDYFEIFKRNIEKLKSIEKQNSEIEKTIAEFDAPLVHKKLMLWEPVFQKWKEIYTDPNHDLYYLVYYNVQIILKEKRKVKNVTPIVLNLGLKCEKNLQTETRKMLYDSLRNKYSDKIRLLLKKIVLQENIHTPYERGNAILLFCTDKAIKQYSDNWDNVPRLNSKSFPKIEKSLYIPVEKLQIFTQQYNKPITNDLHMHRDCTVEDTDCSGTSATLNLNHSRKRGMTDLSPKHDEKEKEYQKRRKLYYLNKSVDSITSEMDKNQENFNENVVNRKPSFNKDQSKINNNNEDFLLHPKLGTVKTIINDLIKERKNMLPAKTNFHEKLQNLQNQTHLQNQDTEQLHLELEKERKINSELISDNKNMLEQISKIREDMENQESQRLLEELKLRSDLQNARKIISKLMNDREDLITERNILQNELNKTRAMNRKLHKEIIKKRATKEEPEKSFNICLIS